MPTTITTTVPPAQLRKNDRILYLGVDAAALAGWVVQGVSKPQKVADRADKIVVSYLTPAAGKPRNVTVPRDENVTVERTVPTYGEKLTSAKRYAVDQMLRRIADAKVFDPQAEVTACLLTCGRDAQPVASPEQLLYNLRDVDRLVANAETARLWRRVAELAEQMQAPAVNANDQSDEDLLLKAAHLVAHDVRQRLDRIAVDGPRSEDQPGVIKAAATFLSDLLPFGYGNWGWLLAVDEAQAAVDRYGADAAYEALA